MNTNRWIITAALLGVVALGTAQAKKDSNTNRQVMDRWFEAIDSKQVDRLGDVETADLEMKMPGPMLIKGSDGHKQMTKMFATAFPNFKHTVSRCVESGDTIACEGSWGGDNTGPMTMPTGQTLPATNKHVSFDWGGIATIKNGKVTTVHVYFDNMGFMQQLGAMPPAPTAMNRK
jgi:predicted ester cyclase